MNVLALLVLANIKNSLSAICQFSALAAFRLSFSRKKFVDLDKQKYLFYNDSIGNKTFVRGR